VLGRQAEHPRLGVARLGVGRDGAQLDEAEAERGPEVGGAAVLVQPGGEADRPGEAQPSQGSGQGRGRGAGQGPGETTRQRAAQLQAAQRAVVGLLGRQGEGEGAKQSPGQVQEHGLG